MNNPFYSKISIVRYLLNRKFRKIANGIKSGKILELGAGPISYKRLFPSCTVISTDLKMYPGVDEIADVTKLKYSSSSFDYVICLSVLEHVFETEKAIYEMYRVLKKGGCVIILTPFLYPLHDEPHDYYRFTQYSYRKLLKNFERVEIDTTSVLNFWIFKKFVLFYMVKAYK